MEEPMMKRLFAAALAVSFACAAQAMAAPADANYFKGKTVTYVVATGAGGGYDTYGRLIARFMQKYLPGSRVLVRNVPGAGHIIGANTIYTARPDGLTFGMFNTGLIYNQLMGLPGIQFDLTKFSWIGKASDEIRVMVVSTKSGYKSIDDVMKVKGPVKFAAAGVGSAAYLDTRILDFILPIDIQTVTGFDGAEGELSMMRGEVVAATGIASSFDQFVRNKNGFYALVMSQLAHDVLPGVPQASQYVTDERGKRLLDLLEALSDLGRLTAGPPNIPPDVLKVLRDAHEKAIKDPELIAEAAKLNMPVKFGSGEFVTERIKQALTQTPETVALLKQAASAR
jgi:tripartite-type tricarboxylate transporter receptor subunit TctC